MGAQIFGLFLLILMFINGNRASVCQETLDYINKKLYNSRVDIAKTYIEDPESVASVMYNIKLKVLWTRELASRALTIGRTSDEMFVLIENNRLMSIGIDLTPPAWYPTPIGLHEVSTFNSNSPMKFIKSLIWRKLMYLLICYEANFCVIYTSTDGSELEYRHTIRHMGEAVDAKFFIVKNHLHLVIATSLESQPSTSVIYRWTGTYMDVITDINLKSVISVVTFDQKGTTILVFSQSDPKHRNIGSQVYKLMIDETSGHGWTEGVQYLRTNQPVAMHLYSHNGCNFLLMLNDAEPGKVFWWDGREFFPWMEVDIQGPGLLNSLEMNGDTFLIVGQANVLNFYKITSLRYELLEQFVIPDIIGIIDMGIWSDGRTISIVLISERAPNLYRVEPWQVFVNKIKKGEAAMNAGDDGSESILLCMKKLMEKLLDRMEDVEKSRAAWKNLHSASENVVVEKLSADVILRSFGRSTILESLEIVSNNTKEIIPPGKLNVLIEALESEVDELVDKSRNLLRIHGTEKLVFSSLTIANAARFESLKTPSLETNFMNNVDSNEKLKNLISATRDQSFNEPLYGRNVVIHNLEVEKMCSVPKNFWLLRNESVKIPLKPITGPADVEVQIVIQNDTVSITSDIFIPRLETKILNFVNLSEFIDNLFIPEKNQVIDGDLVFSDLFLDRLSLNKLNGIPWEELMTVSTDQEFRHPIFIDSLNVAHLKVNRINGVSVEEAAKVSEENIIKGKVVMDAHLKIVDEMILDEKCSLFKELDPVQTYDNVTIVGNIRVRRLKLEDRMDLDSSKQRTKGRDIENLFLTSWTKSGSQRILSPIVTFKKGLSIDELNTEYLNGMREDEYFYTTSKRIPSQFERLHFEKLSVNGAVRRKNQAKNWIEIGKDTVIFNERVAINKLTALNFFSESYNGIPIDLIMNRSKILNESIEVSLPDDIEFDEIIVKNELQVTNLHFETLNNKEVPNFLFIDDDHRVESVKSDEFKAADFRSSAGIVPRAAGFLPSEQLDIIIEGPLIVAGNLNVEGSINQQSVGNYLNKLSASDIRINDPSLVPEDLTVLQDSTINDLYGVNFDNFIKNIFSKSREQTLIGRKIFHRVTAESIDAEIINGKRIKQMSFINDSLVFDGDIIFTKLSADVDTVLLNSGPATWIYGDLSSISARNITRLDLTGNITWRSDERPQTFTKLITNAVRSDSNDIIESPVNFVNFKGTRISSVRTNHSRFSVISNIVGDAVLNTNKSVVAFSGEKRFLNNVEVKELKVHNVTIEKLRRMTVRELNASVVRKFDDDTVIPGTCVFTGDETSVAQLRAQNLGPGMPNISSLFVLSEDEDNYLPNGTHFAHLIISGDAILQSLDGINLDDFLKQRVTLSGNQTIDSSVRFNGPVHVLENVEVYSGVNGIITSDIVLKNCDESQVITGKKTFLADLIVEKDVEARFFNQIDIIEEYNKGILNHDSPVIHGDLIIEDSIELSQDVIVLGRVNGLQLDSFIQDVEHQHNEYIKKIDGNMKVIDDFITKSVATSTIKQSPELFHDFEIEENLKIPQIGNITEIVPLIFGKTTQLNLYGVQSGVDCPGLPDHCTCRNQHVITISGNSSELRRENSSWLVFNFHTPDNQLIINVVTNAISSSVECSTDRDDEYTAISWMTRKGSKAVDEFTHYPEKIEGYVGDVGVFIHEGDAYIVLAMSYDIAQRTNQVDSRIFKLSLKKNRLEVVLSIPMTSASAVRVFGIPGRGSYVLIAAGGPEDPENSGRSSLYRLKPGAHEFEFLRSFYSGGTRRIESLAHRDEDFLILDDVKTHSINIYNYEKSFDNFYLYQSLYFSGRIKSVKTFYSGEFRRSDVFVIVITENRFFLYQYMMVGKFQEVMNNWVHGVLAAAPFYLAEEQYLFLAGENNSTVYKIVKQGS